MAPPQGGYPALGAIGHAQPLCLPLPELAGHTGIRGTTRAGKTVLLDVLAAEAIRSPGATTILDPKGSRTLLARCAAEARRQGKPFALVTPASPQRSASMNVLASAQTPSEVTARIQALMPSAGGRTSKPIFELYPLAIIGHLASAQQALGLPWTLEGLYRVASFFPALEALLMDYLEHLHCHRVAKCGDMVKEYHNRHM